MCVVCVVQRNAAAHGVSGANRLVFLRRMPKADYMNALAVADLFLDTPHYGNCFSFLFTV